MKTEIKTHTVETWYDRRSRLWITQLKDAEGNQIDGASFSGNKAGAEINHQAKVALADVEAVK